MGRRYTTWDKCLAVLEPQLLLPKLASTLRCGSMCLLVARVQVGLTWTCMGRHRRLRRTSTCCVRVRKEREDKASHSTTRTAPSTESSPASWHKAVISRT